MNDEASRTPHHRYDATLAGRIEDKWEAHWEEHQTYRQPNPGEPGFDATKPKYYCLDMFPYPSGSGLHAGHPEGYTATDILSRYKRMRGFNVLHPMGWDAYGLPAEQYAIKTGVHPAITTRQSIDNFRRQLKRFGFAYDWSREIGTCDEDYYRWTQWIFVEIYQGWFDEAADRARPITELEAELAAGSRAPRINPRAAEHTPDEKSRTYGAWPTLPESDRRTIVDSYRLCYIAEQTVNWCPKLGTALANEEVIDGRSERGDYPVRRMPLRQWMFRITAYADRLVRGLETVDWPRSTRIKQTEWIGRSTGAEVDFALARSLGGIERLRVYTTRPDTLFGATYMVVAPEHPLVDALLSDSGPDAVPGTEQTEIRRYVDAARNRSDLERQQSRDKTGVATGLDAINPVNGKRIPIWIADYVLMGYGTGAIMAVPAGDERDFQFATKFSLPIVRVVVPIEGEASMEDPDGCFSGEGIAVNSANDEVSLDGLYTAEAKTTIIAWLEEKGLGRAQTNYRLRDWLFSRQRYWGEPFPIVFDESGHHHAVSQDALPVQLPELEDFAPVESDRPLPLLGKVADWVETTASQAGVRSLPKDAKVWRETNTMPGWAGSCWYFLRYCDPKNDARLVGKEADAYWMGERGVDLYIGGAEHAVLHLLYARFWHMVLYDLGHVASPEPFQKLFHQGLVMSYAYRGADKRLIPIDEVTNRGTEDAPAWVSNETGEPVEQIVAKMSKALKNSVNPDDVIAEYGADTVRLYEMYMGPLDISKPWNTRDISGMFRFLQRTWRAVVDEETGVLRAREEPDPEVERVLHRAIAGVTDDIERFAFNTAIAKLITVVNAVTQAGGMTRDQIHRFARVLSAFAPHLAEEIWNKLGESPSVSDQSWPTWDEAMLVDDTIEIAVQVKGKVKSRVVVAADASADVLEKAALADPKIQQEIAGLTVRKVIVVPGRLVNIVAT
jgi:leucyl-tRNA synthetase